MVITEVYIENFGVLHNYKYLAKKGLNQIYGANGTGKSTFAAFIKAMFFGMPQVRTRKSLDDADRKKFKPWQGGNFGGYIVFEIKDKEYRLERTFGVREKEDTFKLIDAKTGIISADYTSNIGMEIFGVDRDGYSATAWIFGRNMKVGVNDSMHAKLGNTLELENDCANFERGISKITDAIREYSRAGKRGSLHELKSELSAATQDIYELQRKIDIAGNGFLKNFSGKSDDGDDSGGIASHKNDDEWRKRLSWLDDYFSNGVVEEEELLKDIQETERKTAAAKRDVVKYDVIAKIELVTAVFLLIAAVVMTFLPVERLLPLFLVVVAIIMSTLCVVSFINIRRLKAVAEKEDNELLEKKQLKAMREEYLRLIQFEEHRAAVERELIQQKNSFELEQRRKELDELNRKLYEAMEEKSRLEEALRNSQHKYEVLVKTKDYLILAKEKYVSSYMGTILTGIRKYLSLFDEKLCDAVKLDVHMNVSMQVGALTKELSYFSAGIKDIIWLCERFAIIDALYEDEQPLVILDDPFVNLDDEMCVRAKTMLEKVAKDKQIIYMTCKSDRRL